MINRPVPAVLLYMYTERNCILIRIDDRHFPAIS